MRTLPLPCCKRRTYRHYTITVLTGRSLFNSILGGSLCRRASAIHRWHSSFSWKYELSALGNITDPGLDQPLAASLVSTAVISERGGAATTTKGIATWSCHMALFPDSERCRAWRRKVGQRSHPLRTVLLDQHLPTNSHHVIHQDVTARPCRSLLCRQWYENLTVATRTALPCQFGP